MPYLITAYLLNIIDYIFTAHWIHKFGIEIEANPFGRWLFENNVAWVYKIFIVGSVFVALAYIIKRSSKAVIAAYLLLSVYGLIVLYHIFLVIRLSII